MITSSSSSSGERKKTFNHHLKEGREVNTFSHDHRLEPRLPYMIALAGVKPSFMEWSEEVTEFLTVTDYQEFTPLLSVATLSKDVIEKDVMFKGVLSDDPISWKTPNKPTGVVTEITSLRNKPEQKKSTLLKADFFFAMHSSSCDDRRSKCHGQKDHEDFLPLPRGTLPNSVVKKSESNLWQGHGSQKLYYLSTWARPPKQFMP